MLRGFYDDLRGDIEGVPGVNTLCTDTCISCSLHISPLEGNGFESLFVNINSLRTKAVLRKLQKV